MTNDAPRNAAGGSGTDRDASNLRSMTEAQNWFLQHGLPSAIPFRQRWRAVLPRSAPAIAGWAVLMMFSLLVAVLSGDDDIDVYDDPTTSQWIALLILAALPFAVLIGGWAVSRIGNIRARTGVALSAVLLGVISDWWGDDIGDALADTLIDGAMVAAILAGTGVGIGAVLGWAARTTMTHLRAAGRLMIRALPVVLLTVLAFFNTMVWIVATDLDVPRMVLLVGFLAMIAVSFLTAGIRDSLVTVTAVDGLSVDGLSNTPFDSMVRVVAPEPLRFGERLNLLLVVVISQIVQVLLLAFVTGTVFFVMGLIVLNPAVLQRLTNGSDSQSVWFGFTLPLSMAHLHVVALLTALTFMYVSAKAVGDGEYRKNFLDPLLEDLRHAVAARHLYRASLSTRTSGTLKGKQRF